ncbi:hypothetical protein Bca101_084672 [Brassica carinata]
MEGLRRPTKKKGLRKSTKVPLTVSNSTYEKVQANTHRNSSEPVSRVVMGDEGWRKIRLLCPSVSKIIDWVAWNDQKLDFKSIAAAFGLEPATVKLNAKGLSTGKDGAGPLLVDGKLSRVGTKRAHFDPHEDITVNNLGLNRNKKLKDKCSVEECLLSGCNKRKFLSEDRLSSKKLKLNMGDSLGSGGKTCSFTSDGLKRTREDDMIASTSRKKIR